MKVNIIVIAVKSKCLSQPRRKHLALHEQMIPFALRYAIKQYVPLKYNPLGTNNFAKYNPPIMTLLCFPNLSLKRSVSAKNLKEVDLVETF